MPTLAIVTETWANTFIIDLPQLPTSNAEDTYNINIASNKWTSISSSITQNHTATNGPCVVDKIHKNRLAITNCSPHFHLHAIFQNLQLKHMLHIKEILATINNTIPEILTQYKRSRSYCADCSPVAHFFGSATVDDVKTLYQDLSTLDARMSEGFEKMAQSSDELKSFINTTEHRTQLLQNMIQRNHDVILALQQQRTTDANDLIHITSLLLNGVQHLSDYTDLSSMLNTLQQDIELLLHGILSPRLIPIETMKQTLQFISQSLEDNKIPLHLARGNVMQIYNIKQFSVARKNNSIMITVQFPLSPFKRDMHLYKVISFGMPISNETKHVTKIIDLPPFVAYHPDEDVFLELNSIPERDYLQIYLPQRGVEVFKSKQKPTCIMALILKDLEQISKLCKLVLEPNAAKQEVIQLSTGSLLLQFIDNYTITCDDRTPRNFPGCQVCVVDVPCSCQFDTAAFRYLNQMTECKTSIKAQPTLLHAVNLNLLHQFFNTSYLKEKIQPDQLLELPPAISIPNLQIYESEYTKDLGLMESTRINIDKVMKNSQENSNTYRTLSHKLYADIQSNNLGLTASSLSMYNWQSNLILINTLLSGTAIIMVIILFSRLRTITAALLLATKVHGQKEAATQLQFLFQPPTPASQLNGTAYFAYLTNLSMAKEIDPIGALTIIFMVILTIYAIFKLYEWKYPSFNFDTFIEIGNQTSRVYIKWLKIPHNIKFYLVRSNKFLTSIFVTGWIKPELHIAWPELQIVHKYSPLIYYAPTCINLNWFQAYKLRQILQNQYYVLLFTTDSKGNIDLLPLQDSIWESKTPTAPFPPPIPTIARNPLYPPLHA